MEFIKIKDSNLELSFKVRIPDTKIVENISMKVYELNKSVRLNGFRKGKIPKQVLQQKYGSGIRNEVVQETINDALKKITKEENLKLFVSPKVDGVINKEGIDLEFNVDLILKPQIQVPDFTKFTLINPLIKVTQDDIRKEIFLMLEKHEDMDIYEESEAKASRGDFAIVDIDVFIKKEKIDASSLKESQIEIGAGTFLPEIEDAIIGLKKGDKKNISIEMPDQKNPKLSKKILKCEIRFIKLLKAKKNIKIDQSIAKKIGYETVQDLKEYVTKSVENYYQKLKINFLKIKLFDALENVLEFSTPDSLLKKEIENIKSKYKNYQNTEIQESDLLKNNFSYMTNLEFIKISNKKTEEEREAYIQKIAARRLRIGIFIEDFITENNIKISHDEISELVQTQVSFFPGRANEIINIYQKNPQLLESLVRPKLEEKAVEKILTLVHLEEKNFTRDTLEKSLKTLHKL